MTSMRTNADQIVDMVWEKGNVSIGEISKKLGLGTAECMVLAKKLSNIIEIRYPINILRKPYLTKRIQQSKHLKNIFVASDGAEIESYDLLVNDVPATIKIHYHPGDVMRTYSVILPPIGIGTATLLDGVIQELAVNVSSNVEDMTDITRADIVKEDFRKNAMKKISEDMPVTEEQAKILSGIAMHRVYGLDDLEIILGDDMIEEICINSAGNPLIVYQRKHGWLKTNIIIPSDDNTFDYASKIGRRVGKDITNLNPLMDSRLITGDRVMASMYPISMQGNTITIRKFSRDPWTIIDFISPKYKTLSSEIAAFLWMCIQYELNVLVAGGTASGKTSVLNSLCAFIPPGQRVISIEDTREIMLPSHLSLNWIQLTTRESNPDGLGGVTMLNLITSSLRMRPDRIIVGEIRDREEAEVLFEAMHTGHSVYSTMHADTCQHIRRRVTEPPISIPEAELEALHVIMTQYRDRLHGIRRMFELAEIMPGTSERKLGLNYLYRWRVKSDTYESIGKSNRVFNDINLYTGLTVDEIEQDLREKTKILDWMVAGKVSNVNDVGRIMNIYYTNKDELLAMVDKR